MTWQKYFSLEFGAGTTGPPLFRLLRLWYWQCSHNASQSDDESRRQIAMTSHNDVITCERSWSTRHVTCIVTDRPSHRPANVVHRAAAGGP